MTANDPDLLEQFTQQNSQPAFAALVTRHLNLIYSAALRQVRSPQLAEEVAQSVFLDLAQNARQLKPDTILTAWLYQVARRTAIDVVRREARRQLREQIATEMNAMNAPTDDWAHVAPLLDEAMHALDDTDRTAVLLRYFENKSLREVGATLGTSDDAAQKRVSRAVERLREFFTKRGVTVGVGGLVVVISANAVQAAPVGMAVTISSAATLAGTTIVATTTATVTKAIAMTTLQKAAITIALAVAVGAGVYEARQASNLRSQVQTLQQQQDRQASLTAQIQQLQRERNAATNRLAALADENTHLKSGLNAAELLKLRGQVGTLRQQLDSAETRTNLPSAGIAKIMGDPALREYVHQTQLSAIKSRYADLFKELKLTPEQIETFTQSIGDLALKNSDIASALAQGTVSQAEFDATEDVTKSEMENSLKSLLGVSGYARMKEFGDEIPAQTTVKLLNGQLGASPLTDAQSAQLVQAVKAEPYQLTHGIMGDLDDAFFGSQADADAYLQKVAESNQRVLQQAASFLAPDQLSALNNVLTNGINARITQAAALTQKR